VNTGIEEFDYPTGNKNATYRHGATDGIDVGGTLGKILWAIRLQSNELLFSDYIEADSQVLLYRDVMTRAKKIAPWLIYDEQAYPALVDGHIVWIFDAFTASDHVPYSQPMGDGTNYLRDSVKVTVDAYTGETLFYANGDDPLRDAWSKIFPGVIVPQGEVPSSLAKHFRYPEKMFAAQADVYRIYHMADPMVFYNKEDQWERVSKKADQPVRPSYLLLDPPGPASAMGMNIVQWYAAPGRDNLLGIMTAGCEPTDYGQQTVYAMPKKRVVLGPQQVIARIEQDPEISPVLSLWDQRGSTVIFGDMLVVPVEDSIAYIQPIFLQAEKTAMTELVSVVLVTGDRVMMADDLPAALALSLPTTRTRSSNSPTATDMDETRIEALLEQAIEAKRNGKTAEYEAVIDELRSLLQTLDPGAGVSTTL
jgi:uncharacterized membrane protein (UPF0182 family)